MFRSVALTLSLFAATPLQAAELKLDVTGFEDPQGTAMIRVYADAAAMKAGDGIASIMLTVTAERRARAMVDLPAGHYAIAVFHDKNGNQELDQNLVGMPSEPYGFSNNARGSFGPPSFEAAAIDLPATGANARIEVR